MPTAWFNRDGGVTLETGAVAWFTRDGGVVLEQSSVAPTSATLTGPTSGSTGAASTNFTITLDQPATGTINFTPSGTVGTNTFSPSTPQITVGQTSVTFTDTAASDGTHVVSITNDGGLSNVGTVNYATTTPAATGVTMSGPSGGTSGVASSNFTVGVTPIGGTITGTVTVTPSDGGGGGTFTPTTVGLTTGSPTATFTYTPASAGTKTISATNNGGLTNPGNLSYVSSAAAVAMYPIPRGRLCNNLMNF